MTDRFTQAYECYKLYQEYNTDDFLEASIKYLSPYIHTYLKNRFTHHYRDDKYSDCLYDLYTRLHKQYIKGETLEEFRACVWIIIRQQAYTTNYTEKYSSKLTGLECCIYNLSGFNGDFSHTIIEDPKISLSTRLEIHDILKNLNKIIEKQAEEYINKRFSEEKERKKAQEIFRTVLGGHKVLFPAYLVNFSIVLLRKILYKIREEHLSICK